MGVELLLIIGLQAYQSLSQNNIVIVSAPFLLVLRETNKLSKN
jgi:uncharacterized membrane protein (DUF441 family)